MEMAAEDAHSLLEPFGLGDLCSVLERASGLEKQLPKAVEAAKAMAEAARVDREREKQVQVTLKVAECMRDQGKALAMSGLDAAAVAERGLEMAKAELSSAAGSGSTDAAETSAAVNADEQLADIRKKRKAVHTAVSRLRGSVEDGEKRLRELEVPEEVE